jgi:antitoxin YefM
VKPPRLWRVGITKRTIRIGIVIFSEAGNSVKDVIDQAVADADVAVISGPNAPDAVVMSLDYYSNLIETVHHLSSPANASHLAR